MDYRVGDLFNELWVVLINKINNNYGWEGVRVLARWSNFFRVLV